MGQGFRTKEQSIKKSKTASSVILESSSFHSQNSDTGFSLKRIAPLRNTFKSNHQFSPEQNFIYLKVSVQEKKKNRFFGETQTGKQQVDFLLYGTQPYQSVKAENQFKAPMLERSCASHCLVY